MLKKKKLKSISSIKKKLWKLFSTYIRQRGMNDRGLNRCISCGEVGHWTTGNAGHFYHGHSKLTFMDERNVHYQCVRCNLYLSGNLIPYSEFMRKEYGPDIIEVLRESHNRIWKPSRQELANLIEYYKSKVKETI